MGCSANRAVSACALVLGCILVGALLPVTAGAGVTRQAVLCGDYGITCDPASGYAWSLQKSITVEHSLNSTGEYVWVGNAGEGGGEVVGDDPLNNSSASPTVVEGDYYGSFGELENYISGLAYDPGTNTLFVADSNDSRVLAFPRGDFSGDPVDYTNPAQAPAPLTDSPPAPSGSADGQFSSTGGPLGMAFSTFNDTLYVADYFNARVQMFTYTSSSPTLGYVGKFSHNWDTDDQIPLDVAVDPSDGHVFVTTTDDQDNVAEFEADGTFVGLVGGSGTGGANDVGSVAVDSPDRLLYLVKANSIDIYSLETRRKLGTLPGTDFFADQSSSLVDVDVDPVGRDLYVVANTSGDFPDNPPVAAYALDPKPICTVGPTVTVNPGQTVPLPLNCTDTDGAPIQEFHRTSTPPALGAITPNPDRTALSYTAGQTPGNDIAQYTVLTANGKSAVYSQPIQVGSTAAPQQPVVHVSANLKLGGGDVFVKLPGSNTWVKLTADMLIPVGTVIDARNGTANLTFANADGSTYSGVFWDGIFQVTQGSGANPIATMKLRDDLAGAATTASYLSGGSAGIASGFKAFIAKKKGKKKNGLWGDAHGKFKTSGKGGSAAVRGTRWYVGDYQCGALFKVQRGKVLVNPASGKNFFLKGGHRKFIYYKRCAR